MNKSVKKQVDVPIEDIDLARRLYRRFFLSFFVIGIGGLFAGSYLTLFPLPGNPSVAGFDIGEWVLMITLLATILLVWTQTYKISRLLKNSAVLYMVIVMPILLFMLQIEIDKAAQRAGYRMGPFLGSLRSIEK
jgi:hypothetical protein